MRSRAAARMAGLSLIFVACLGAASAAEDQRRIRLFPDEVIQIAGDTALKEFTVRLPSHVAYVTGCELAMTLHPSASWFKEVCLIRAAVNGRSVARLPVAGTDLTNQSAIQIRAAIPPEALMPDWNRVSLDFVLPRTPDLGWLQFASWELRGTESYLALASERLPLFPELARFPEPFVEERLFENAIASGSSNGSVLVLLLSRDREDAHLRTCGLLGARLGQLGYLSEGDCRLGWLDEWEKESRSGHTIVIGLARELGEVPLPGQISALIAGLQSAQGFLAEFIVTNGIPRRCLVISGSDAAGLEKAALTLVNPSALRSAPPNPAVIVAGPTPPARTAPSSQAQAAAGREPARLEGIYRGERSVRGWQLPPGSRLQTDGRLNLRLSHSPPLRPASGLEVFFNGYLLDRIPLTPDNAALRTVPLVLPKEVPGADPSLFTFRTYLDIDPTPCDRRNEGQAWVEIAPSTTVEAAFAPVEVATLDQMNALFLRDPGLGNTALLLPENSSLEELQLVFDYAMHLGEQVANSPSLWLEVASYRPRSAPRGESTRGRAVLLFSPVPEWPAGLPADLESAAALRYEGGQNNRVAIQGRKVRVSGFEPSLVFAQLLDSPWSSGEKLVMAGGWAGFAIPAMRRLLMDPGSAGKLPGDLAAMDAEGRAAAYELDRVSSESFWERVRRQMPLGLSAAETSLQVEADQVRARKGARLNRGIVWICGTVIFLLLLTRVVLMLLGRREPESAPKLTAAPA